MVGQYNRQIFISHIKGSDRQSEVVELSMQYCAQILLDSFQTYETLTRSINPEFERKVDVQT